MEDELERVLGHYTLGKLKASRPIEHGFVNNNWVIETAQGRYFLKRRHPSLRQPDLIHAQHDLIRWLRQRNFPAPTVVPNAAGETFVVFDGEFYEIHEYVEGEPFNHDRPAHLEEAARTLGHYHISVEGCAPQALCDLDELYSQTNLNATLTHLTEAWRLDQDSDLAQIARKLKAHTADLSARYARHGALPCLIIHGDYYAGNLLFNGDRIVAVVDYDKVCWQPRVVEMAEALIYFASPRPGHMKHLVYPGFLEWEPFARFLQSYAHVVILSEAEAHALPDYIRCIWLSVSLERLLERGPNPPKALEALQEVLALADWAKVNTHQMAEVGLSSASKIQS